MNTVKIAATIAVALGLWTTAALAQNVTPQGRLTLQQFSPVMTADVTGATTVYYFPYVGNTIPISNSTSFTFVNEPILPITDLILNSSVHLAGNIYDVFAFMHGGQVTLGAGPAWSSSTVRSAAINTTFGVETNEYAITLTNNSNTYSIPISEATYLGSVYMTANGQTSMQLTPTPASGGTANVMGLYNAYNRIRTTAYCRDNTSSWNYSTASWHAADTSTSNRISFLDGLQQSSVMGNYSILGATSTNTIGEYIGLNEDSSTTTPNIVSGMASSGSAPGANQYNVTETFYPLLGLHYVQAVEYASGTGTATFLGTNSGQQLMALAVTLDM